MKHKKSNDFMMTRLTSFPEFDPSPVIEIDLNGTVTYINPTAKRLFPDLHECWMEHPYLAGIAAIAAELTEKGSTSYERDIKVGDAWYRQVLYIVKTERRVRVYGIDISERKQSEEALHRYTYLMDSVMQSTDVMLVFLDPKFELVWVNLAYAKTCRMKPEEMIGKNHFALYPDAENEAIFRRVLDTGEGVFYKDKPFKFPDQPERGLTYWDWSLTPAKDVRGKITGLVFSLRETTKFKQAEDALRTSEANFRGYFENLAVGTAQIDLTGHFIRVNDRFCEITGYSRKELLGGMGPPDLDHPEDRDSDQKQIARFFRGEIPHYEAEKRYVRKDGGVAWVRVFASAVRDMGGKICYTAGVIDDITNRKNAEEEREKLINELKDALAKIKTLSSMLPICAYCKKIRNDKGYWEQVDSYISKHTDTVFSHGMCPECAEKAMKDIEGFKNESGH